MDGWRFGACRSRKAGDLCTAINHQPKTIKHMHCIIAYPAQKPAFVIMEQKAVLEHIPVFSPIETVTYTSIKEAQARIDHLRAANPRPAIPEWPVQLTSDILS